MYPPKFGYVIPDSLDEALDFLEKNEDARPLAGGFSLIPMLKLRLLRPTYLVELRRLKELHYIKNDEKTVYIGALATHFEIATNQIVKKNVPVVSSVASVIADPQIRNMGTIGGELAQADPVTDHPASLLVTEAKVRVKSKGNERIVPFEGFQKDIYTTDLKTGELITEVQVPILKGYTFSYKRMEDIAAVAVLLKKEGEVIKDVRIATALIGPVASRLREAEKVLQDSKGDEKLIEEASQKAMDSVNPIPSARASSEYKKKLVKVYTRRALMEALGGKQ
ncbi:carbon monoxide dehydrogenase [Sulfodiicoccus acidiphilus]|uniref:Carbon monoxide dehydrogenase n=1 Tax=Sulfodiicoccus acidiphilus TaxID=1670455 RepID=A0A348B3U0_9CREN|nr:glyceraldehyde dehydrogenase subunit beta [Sulfodiicoccus acidiphilus]BBD72842.1 carbon monoxide dehydrogenase [Sulfodiicoccus acidiphilus]GGT88564.1 carbon monoxide dehydrogenase [Sulfodiicoccus acidiphilus]